MVKTYILAPNWTTAPPPDGPIKLGHLLDDLTEFVPINRDKVVEITPDQLNKQDIKKGFSTVRSSLIAGELGFFARVIGLVGVGVGADIYYKKAKDDIMSCEELVTATFDPTPEYIAATMDLPKVKQFMEGCGYKAPVYMITGFKIGKGASLVQASSKQKGVRMEGGLNPPGSPVQAGVKGGLTQAQAKGTSWQGSTDFIIAFRVKKIWYRHSGKVGTKSHNKDAVMQDAGSAEEGQGRVRSTDDDITPSEVSENLKLATGKDFEDEEEVNWIIPDVQPESS
ncbi:hypothetical protein NEMBOFW57_001120 [Staphylotrichum longicolle]|uniref:Uncharacterized protein n=1 Tax=Staphylotrichum longicolle TaxID=669026 RepID=A0AAD4F1Q8_9PEZI|nr:hypothetical protein NEMBOFW57_001120 [Staphylotrichum longicolle]